jgi:hypothetical protein
MQLPVHPRVRMSDTFMNAILARPPRVRAAAAGIGLQAASGSTSAALTGSSSAPVVGDPIDSKLWTPDHLKLLLDKWRMPEKDVRDHHMHIFFKAEEPAKYAALMVWVVLIVLSCQCVA